MYRMLGKLRAATLAVGIVRRWLDLLQKFSTGYDVSASLNATFFALVLALV
jgi:hypothetical protein